MYHKKAEWILDFFNVSQFDLFLFLSLLTSNWLTIDLFSISY